MRTGRLFAAILSLAAMALTGSTANAENGVTANKILFGQVAALDGPAAALGQGMRAGLLAAFNEANQAGRIKGHTLDLTSLDDGYEPDRAIAAAKTLINDNKVFALIGAVGTPTSAAVQPIAAESGVPFIGAFTGAEFLRDPSKTDVVNVRASYFQETETMVEHLTQDLGVSRIAIFYQDDAYGQAELAGVTRALDKRKMSLVSEGTYERNTTAVKSALLSIRKGDPQAVIMIGAYKPSSEFIKLARRIRMDATFVNISFVDGEALAKELGPDGAGVVVTEVVPFPWDTSIGLVARYQAALKVVNPNTQPGFVSLEGYIVGRMVAAALGKIPGEVTRQALLEAITKTGTFDLDGMTLSYGPGNNRGSSKVFLTVVQSDGTLKSVDKLSKPNS